MTNRSRRNWIIRIKENRRTSQLVIRNTVDITSKSSSDGISASVSEAAKTGTESAKTIIKAATRAAKRFKKHRWFFFTSPPPFATSNNGGQSVLVAGLGFEPTVPRSERGVLPLHHPAIGRRSGQRDWERYEIVTVFQYRGDTHCDQNRDRT